jgi:Tfp pilus assembly protein PilZ
MDERVGYSDGTSEPIVDQQRIFERFPSRFPARFKDTRNDFGTDVFLRDASAGGARITTRERLYLNDNVTLEVDLPDGKGALNLRGQVVWVKSKSDNVWDAGLKFHKVMFMDMWRPYKINEVSSTA